MAIEIPFEKNKSLKKFNTWLVGGAAEFYSAPTSLDELKAVMVLAYSQKLPMTVLGGGSNVLVSDVGIQGMVIHTHLLNKVEILEEGDNIVIETLTGTPKAEVLKHFLKMRLQPAVFLAGLPGDMGGGVVMNAGVGHKVKPREFCEIVDSFDILRLNENGHVDEISFSKDQVQWNYRKSLNWQPGIISKVRVRWPNTPNENVLKEVRDGNKRRKDSQPLNMPSCGSVFKNPEGDHAGRLIEASGLKGFSIGGAQVSMKHANFIVNTGGATATDINNLILHIQKTVKEKFNIPLTNEVIYLGVWNK